LSPFDELHGIIGSNAFRSLSPQLHNAAHRSLRRRVLFVTFDVNSIVDFWHATVTSGKLESIGLRLNGLTVTSPFKEAAIPLAGERSLMVERAGSTNIVTRVNGQWRADTTDPDGVLSNLAERRIPVRERPVAVVGCGASGRAVAGALKDAGADVTLVNRGLERGRLAVQLLDLPFVPLSEFSVAGFSVVINATPVGSDDGELPFRLDDLVQDAVIVDHVYRIGDTPLIAATRASGRVGIEGREVLRQQVLRQYRLMNGVDMPAEPIEALLGLDDRPTVAAEGVSWT
jgi:3-dehydroquinate dehydratase/shikimate dehydrogenase